MLAYSLRIQWSDGGYSFFSDIGLSRAIEGAGLAKRVDSYAIVQIEIY